MYRFLILLLMVPTIAWSQFVTPSEGGGTSDSIGYDLGGAPGIDGYLYPAYLFEGANITFTIVGEDSITIAGSAGAGTADSMGVDTDGNGTIDAYLYSTTAKHSQRK